MLKTSALLFFLLFMSALFYSLAGSKSASSNIKHKQRGVSWVAAPEAVTDADFEKLVANNVNWIVQTPFGWQKRYDA